ncbi:MAG: DUF6514 family protein [Oscillospiraceae bacterium]|jgi:hypothetical protein
MKEILWDEKEMWSDEYDILKTKYYLLVEEIQVGDTLLCENYGIRLCLHGTHAEESVTVSCVSPDMKRITSLMDLLSQNLVTPIALLDVLEDWLA